MVESKKYSEFDAMLRAERRRHYLHQLTFFVNFGAFLVIIYGIATFSWIALGGGSVVLAIGYGAGVLEKRRRKAAG